MGVSHHTEAWSERMRSRSPLLPQDKRGCRPSPGRLTRPVNLRGTSQKPGWSRAAQAAVSTGTASAPGALLGHRAVHARPGALDWGKDPARPAAVHFRPAWAGSGPSTEAGS